MSFIQLNRGRFAYVREGQGIPVLLLHGLGSSTQDWQPQINELARYAEVWALDLRGHGASDPLRAPTTVAEMAQDVAEFIGRMGLQGCVLVGISMGGMVGFELVARHSTMVAALVAINSAPSFPLDSLKVRLQVGLRLMIIRVLGLKLLGRMVARKLFPYEIQQPLRKRVALRLANNDRASYLYAIKAIMGWSCLPQINQVDLPILVVAGDRDYTPLAFKQAYTEQLLNAELAVVCDSGHATPLDQPEQLNVLLKRFISDHQAQAHNEASAYAH